MMFSLWFCLGIETAKRSVKNGQEDVIGSEGRRRFGLRICDENWLTMVFYRLRRVNLAVKMVFLIFAITAESNRFYLKIV